MSVFYTYWGNAPNSIGALPQTPIGGLFEKSPPIPLKNFELIIWQLSYTKFWSSFHYGLRHYEAEPIMGGLGAKPTNIKDCWGFTPTPITPLFEKRDVIPLKNFELIAYDKIH